MPYPRDLSITSQAPGATSIIKPGQGRILGHYFYGLLRDRGTFQRNFDAPQESFPAHADTRVASVPRGCLRNSGPEQSQRGFALAPTGIQDEIVHCGRVARRCVLAVEVNESQ